MTCSEARHALWPPEGPRLAEADVLEVRQHVQGCPACESYFAQDRSLLEAYERAKQERAPQILRERVFDALARERSRDFGLTPPRHVSRRWFVAVAASVAGLLAGGSLVSLRNVPDALNDGGLFAEDYLRRAVAQERIVSSDVDEVSRFLTRELGRSIMPLQLAGLDLTSAEICLIEGRRGAMIQYVEDGRKISHYLIPQEGTPRRDPDASTTFNADNIGGPALITWATPEIEQALVGEVPEARLMELARNASL
jgi:anti-sigma factor RsiW